MASLPSGVRGVLRLQQRRSSAPVRGGGRGREVLRRVRRRRRAQDGYVQEVERRDGGVPCQRLRDVRGHGIWDIAGERGRGCADIPSLRGLR